MTSSKLDSPIFSPSKASDGCLVTIPSCASFLCYRSGKMHCPSPDAPLTAHLTNWPISHPLDNQPAQKSCLHFTSFFSRMLSAQSWHGLSTWSPSLSVPQLLQESPHHSSSSVTAFSPFPPCFRRTLSWLFWSSDGCSAQTAALLHPLKHT